MLSVLLARYELARSPLMSKTGGIQWATDFRDTGEMNPMCLERERHEPSRHTPVEVANRGLHT